MSEVIENPTLEEEETIIQKPKCKLNENQMAAVAINLAKGRANLAAKKQKQKEEAQIIKTNEIVIKKADKLKRITAQKEQQVKTIIGDDDDDVEEIIEHITKKPKKKE